MGSFNEFHIQIILNLIFFLFYVGTSIWVYFDSRNIKKKTGSNKIKPIIWLIGCLALWIVAIPIYLWNRKDFNR